jgi:Cu2+-exporting ATPase
VQEVPGHGLEARAGASQLRLGRADWALARPEAFGAADAPATVLARDGELVARFVFREHLRDGAPAAIAALRGRGLDLEILSGDAAGAVARLAAELGVPHFEGGILPGGKLARLEALRAAGRKVLMVGDGLNDAPALVAAHVSMAPSDAVDVGRNAADFVFMRGGLEAVPFAFAVAQRARRLIRQNFGLAVLYNAVALPFAIAGLVTPLAAALAMSASSILVVVNALRLDGRQADRKRAGRRMPLRLVARLAR